MSGGKAPLPPGPPLAPLPLAQGDLDPEDARQLDALKCQIRELGGFYCHGYKEKCLRRRLAVRMRARGVHRYAEYGALLSDDAAELARLLSTLTINVSKFFRNAEAWTAIRERVVPRLFALDAPAVRVWSAGCASGEEPYTLAILLREHAERTGQEAALERFRIVGTDIDRDTLEEARRAEYPALALSETPAPQQERWFVEVRGRYRLDPAVTSMVTFRPHDLLTERIALGWHLVICRNVIIYFERAVQDDLFERLAAALSPGSLLVLGKVETLFGPAARAFRPLAAADRIYERV